MQVVPKPELRHIVRHYLLYYPKKSVGKMRFFSDGNPGIIVPFDNRSLPFFNGTNTKPGEILVYGIIDNYIDIPTPPLSGMLVVVLQPYALSMLCKMPILKAGVCRINDFFPEESLDLQYLISKMSTPQEIINQLEAFLVHVVHGKNSPDEVINLALNKMQTSAGNIGSASLIKDLKISERQLERKFISAIGLSPKAFSQILRINSYIKELRKEGQKNSLVTSALEAGYYDQAHLNNHFKAVTGTTPLNYLSHADQTAMNLFSLS